MHHVHGTHNPVLVALSILIAVLGSWTALDLLRRVRANSGSVRLWWLLGAAVATGGAIWSMHFIAMLAYELGLPIRYDIDLTILSMLLAIGATGAGLATVSGSRQAPAGWRIGLASLAMGSGICLMHYMGMAAMRLGATPSYDRGLVAASALIAVGASAFALLLALRERSLPARALGALALGLAITGMHYTAMAAVDFLPLPGQGAADTAGLPVQALALGVAGCTLLLLALALVAAMVDRRIERMALREAEALRNSEERLRTVLERLPVGVLVGEPASGRILFANPEAERILGLRPERLDLPWDRAGRVTREQLLHRRPDGAARYLELSIAALEAGPDGLAIASFEDVTARVMAEQALRRAQRLDAMGQLTGGVAHDFNNLLMVVSGNLQLLMRRTQDEVLLRFARSAAEAVRRGSDVTRRLLAFAREQPLRPAPLALGELLPDFVENVLLRTLGGRVRIETTLPAGLWPVLADRDELEAAVLNLAINSRDAMPEGGRLTLAAANIPAGGLPGRVRGLPQGDYVALTLADTGHGMPEEVLARAFEPFFTTKPVGRGSGLGLAQVYGFAAQSGGTATVESRPGEGTRVTLWLPRARGADEAGPRPAEQVA
ncbi:PAS domain-containing protein [Belnapia sp. T6]|uniref:histidine kinase n=1 Tax=Belnapia mucosa TaxID=2804532 RepID=A0ABS1V519_9PROT|nr:MHYT domain-containing protein [Belnapia mucosa]MBL6455408.1 PAS domain-containing protein [Belnapia mucosa]